MKAMKTMMICFVLLCGAAVLGAQTPEWQWAVGVGGTSWDEAKSIAIDSQGNQYVTGWFVGTVTFGSYTLTSTSSAYSDIFAAKLDSSGNWLWAVKAGTADNDHAYGIAVDGAGNAYVTGHFLGTATFGSHTLTTEEYVDVFVAKLGPNGNWIWAVKSGGSDTEHAYGIAVDGVGNAYVTGEFRGTATFGSHTLTASGSSDIFAAKLDPAGNWLWAVSAGGSSYEKGYSISVDGGGNVYVTGEFRGTATFGSHTLTGDYIDIFAAKLDPSGNWLWAVKAGGAYADRGSGIALDGVGDAYVCGSFEGTATFGNHTLIRSGHDDIYVAKLDPSGNWLWAVKAGGTDFDYGWDIALDGVGNPYVTGTFRGTATFGSHTLTEIGSNYDIFAAKLDPNGNWLWAFQAGGTDTDYGYGIAVDGVGNAYVTGWFEGTATFGSHSLTASGSNDIFIAKLIPPSLIANFSADTISGPYPHTVQFSDQSTPGQYPIMSWLWSFGDGDSSTQQNPLHTYTTSGVYTVSLTVIDQSYQTSTLVRPDYITVVERVYNLELLSQESLSFGSVYLEEQSDWQPVTLANSGNVDLTLGDPTFFQQPTQFEWQWQQRDVVLSPGAEATLLVRFVPQAVGPVADVLYIANNSTNLPVVEVQLSATGEYVPPAIPENVVISMAGDNAVITWDAVTQNTHGQPITPDGYLVYYNGSSDAENGLFYFLAVTPELTHTHIRVGEFASNMFYRVKAYKYYGRGSFDLAALGLEPGMTEAEVARRLKLPAE